MKSKKKFVLVANCQARPIAQFMEAMSDEVEITKIAIVHLLDSDDEAEYKPYFEEADFIIAQQVHSNYPCSFVRTDDLKQKYNSKVYTIVNLYAQIYDLGWFYLRKEDRSTVLGPLESYHNKIIYESWKDGTPKGKVLNKLNEYRKNESLHQQEVNESLNTLKAREKLADFKISDYIEHHYQEKRLFFTFNHPSSYVLRAYSKRILKKLLGIPQLDLDLSEINEPLANAIPANVIESNDIESDLHKGFEVHIDKDLSIKKGNRKFYNNNELIDTLYKIYNIEPNLNKSNSNFIPKKIIQYWDKTEVPIDVSQLMQSWKKINNDYEYKLFNFEKARKFIFNNYDEKIGALFDNIAMPAMQSDFFRVAYIYINGGIYIDAATLSNKSMDTFIADCKHVKLMRKWHGGIWNGLIAAPPKSPLLRRILKEIINNVDSRSSENIWAITGPGVFNAIAGEDSLEAEIIAQNHCNQFFSLVNDLDHKGDKHWSKQQKERSIYKNS